MRLQRIRLLLGTSIAALAIALAQSVSAQTVTLESWENTLDGWSVPPSYNAQPFTPSFSTSSGVTDGSYSLAITATSTTGPNYGQMLAGPSSQGLTTILGHSTSLSLDVYTPPGSFGYYLQFDIDLNNADTGFQSLDGYSYPSTVIGSETTITVPISAGIESTLASSANPTALFIQIGGGNSGVGDTMYLDNLRVTEVVPEPSTIALLGFGLLSLVGLKARRMR